LQPNSRHFVLSGAVGIKLPIYKINGNYHKNNAK